MVTAKTAKPLPKVLTTKSPDFTHNTTGTTPSDHPDVEIVIRPWWVRVLIRFTYTFLSSLLGLWLGLNFIPAAGDMFPIVDAWHKFIFIVQMAFLTSLPVAIKNIITFLGELDKSMPDLAG